MVRILMFCLLLVLSIGAGLGVITVDDPHLRAGTLLQGEAPKWLDPSAKVAFDFENREGPIFDNLA